MECSEALEQQVDLVRYLLSQRVPPLYFRRFQSNTVLRADGGEVLENRADLMLDAALRGSTYYWSPEVCNLIQATAPLIPEWTMVEMSLPSLQGFCWFASPLRASMTLPGGESAVLKFPACTWTTYTAATLLQGSTGPSAEVVAERYVGLVFYMRTAARRAGEPADVIQWLVGRSYEESQRDLSGSAALSSVPDPEITVSLELMKVFAAMISFLSQCIMVTPRARQIAPHGAGWPPCPA